MGRRLPRPGQPRLVAVGVVLMLAWAAVGYRLFQVQGVQASEYASQSLDQRLRRVTLAADRGTIYDRDGRELAVSVDAETVFADPREIEDPEATAAALAEPLGLDPARLAERLAADGSFSYVARQVERRTAAAVRELDLAGIHFLTESKRVYPSGSLAAQILGFVGTDNRGLEGLEFQYDRTLAGQPGELVFERDGSPAGDVAIPQGESQIVPAVPGASIRLSLDGELQFLAERSLAAWVTAAGAASGQAVVLDTRTFDVLAMANFPTFDANRPGEANPARYRNRAVIDTLEPGSTQKLITAAAAIEEGVVEPATTFLVPDAVEVADRPYRDYVEHDPATWNVTDIVGRSSNVGVILIWQQLGNELFFKYLQSFGLGRPTGVDFPGEVGGVLYPVEEWCDSCGASTAIGYRTAVTPLQMTAAYAAVANDGLWIEPRLVDEVIDASGRPVEVGQRQERRILSPETAATMRSMLEKVVDEGTGTKAAVEGFRVGGKTGTTRKFQQDTGTYGREVVASFIGVAPIEYPVVAVGVFIDSPQEFRLDTGGTVAAPAFAEIMEFALHQTGQVPVE